MGQFGTKLFQLRGDISSIWKKIQDIYKGKNKKQMDKKQKSSFKGFYKKASEIIAKLGDMEKKFNGEPCQNLNEYINKLAEIKNNLSKIKQNMEN